MKGREFLRPEGSSFWQFLVDNKIPFQKAHFPFLTEEPVPKIKPVFSWEEYLSLTSRGEALTFLYKGLGRALNYVGPVLDLEREHGFNDHTDRHTLWVSQTGMELLSRAGISFDRKNHYDSKTEVLITLAGMLHDIGNLMSRTDHSNYSEWIVDNLFFDREHKKDEWEAVKKAMLYHEEPVLAKNGESLKNGSPLQWALVASDKMHVGRDRIGTRSTETGVEMGAFEADIHILINSLIVRSSWVLMNKNFVWQLDFSVDQLAENFAGFTRKEKERLWVPDFFVKKYRGEGIKFRDTFKEIFIENYGSRVSFLAESIFLLYPWVDKFIALLVDNDINNKVGAGNLVLTEIFRNT